MIITFFGHSSYMYNAIEEEKLFHLIEAISHNDIVEFYLGGYGKFDALAEKCCKRYKEKHGESKIIFITPYINKWLDDRKEYINKRYDEIIYPELEGVPPKYAILRRNEWMIKKANHVFFYVNTHYGGAYKAMLFAAKHNVPYTNIYSGNYIFY